MLIDNGLELLDDSQCAALLKDGRVGRVGVTVSGLPVILPVNYVYFDGAVYFRTGEGSKLRAAADHAVIAFEVDAWDADSGQGWSVLVIGRSTVVDDPQTLAPVEVVTWAAGKRDAVVRLESELVTGRRIAGAE